MPFLTRSSISETSGSASSLSHVDVWGAGLAGGKEGPARTAAALRPPALGTVWDTDTPP